MKMRLGKVILLSLLAVIAITSLYTLVDEGRNYIGKNYFDSDDFQSELSQYQTELVPLVLVELDPEELKKDIAVTANDIQEYRYRYGGLESQLDSIRMQYEGAEEQALIDERDQKLKDITRNFQDDQYVENKIKKEKEKEVDAYFQALERAKREFEYHQSQFVYDLENVKTGEKFTSGGLDGKLAFEKVFSSKNGYLTENPIYYLEESLDVSLPPERFKGTIAITKDSILNGSRAHEYSDFVTRQWIFYGLLVGGIIAGFLFVRLYRGNRELFDYKPGREKFRALPIDVRIALIIVSAYFALLFSNRLVWSILYSYRYMDIPITSLLFSVVLFAVTIYMCEWLIRDYDWKDWENSWILGVWKALKGVFNARSIGLQILILLVVIFFWGFGTMLLFQVPEAIIVWIGASLFIGIPTLLILLSKTSYLNQIIRKSEDMVKGIAETEIEVKGHSAIAQLAANLNHLRGRVQTSRTEQVKSERLKTELITNVSHDLRTPLTSIITYTDLLKNPNLTDEERASYIAILDKKSMRLKTLIEDLFEVSKMASGNMELEKRKVDLVQLLTQAIAEHQEDIDKQGLDFRVTIGTKPIMAYVDGQKWWRMLDNLIINTLKYAMPNTRVYINLDQEGQEAVFVIKNIANYELGNNDIEELTERFKRADTSRHTEGSGLGLAIAQSIVDLHGGVLNIEVDGDLFKVTVRVQAV